MSSLVSDRLNELYKKYFQDTDYKMGQSFDPVKNNMSNEDYEKSQKLLDYYSQQNNLENNFNDSKDINEKARLKALEQNAISNEKNMMYLPEYLKLQGMGGLGVSQSSIIEAQNNYNNARNTINSESTNRLEELRKNYNTAVNDIDSAYTDDEYNIREKYRLAFETDSENLRNNLETSILEKVYTFNSDEQGRISAEDKEKLKQMIHANKDYLTEGDLTYLNNVVNNYEERPEEEVVAEEEETEALKEFDSIKTSDFKLEENDGVWMTGWRESDNFTIKDSNGRIYGVESGGTVSSSDMPVMARRQPLGSIFAYQGKIYYKESSDRYVIVRARSNSYKDHFEDVYNSFYKN